MDWEKLLIFYANHGALAGFEGDFPLRLDFQHPVKRIERLEREVRSVEQ